MTDEFLDDEEDSVDLNKILEALKLAAERKKFRAIDYFTPYPKQQEFYDAGLTARERLLMAGNQLGKTEAGAVEVAYHLTGEYPDDWLGHRFTHPIRAWAGGESSILVRDVQQKKLCGPPGVDADFGSGYIPRDRFVDKPSLARGVTDAYDTIQVEHRTNGVVDGTSTLTFKSYEQGRQKWQGEPVDLIWMDEEPDEEIYNEAITRTNATGGIILVTFTPLKGMSTVVMRFLQEASDDRVTITMTIDDVGHISPEQKAKIIASYPAHERDARTRGIPMLGSGRIFPIAQDAITEPTLEYVPTHWTKLWSIDFGIDHPFAAVLQAWDKDADIIHILHAFKVRNQTPIQHAAAMKPIGGGVPVAWPHDGNTRDAGDLKPLADQYKAAGLKMLPTHATFPDGSISTEAGIMEMQERFETGRIKVAAHLTEFLQEFGLYHRKNGLIVKLNDDIMSATRIGVMARRFGRTVPLGPGVYGGPSRSTGVAKDIDFDLF